MKSAKRCSMRLPPALLAASMLAAGFSVTSPASAGELADELKAYPARIVYETYREGNWELFTVAADGSSSANLTATPKINELYPHVSPDGTKISFVVDETEGASKVRNVYLMNMDGSGRTLVARNARQPCWNSDGTMLAYLKGMSDEFTYTDYATKGIVFYDVATGQHHEHPNQGLEHLYNECWSPDGKWFVSTVHAGMGYKHAILAIEADGPGVYNLQIPGCRPDISPDGKRVAWGASDWVLAVGDLDFGGSSGTPQVTNIRKIVTSQKPMKIYHVDWSPDGRYVAFSRGPETKRMGRIPEIVGVRAEGWDICVADPATTDRWVQITTDGNCNKEPDWIPERKVKP